MPSFVFVKWMVEPRHYYTASTDHGIANTAGPHSAVSTLMVSAAFLWENVCVFFPPC